MTYITPYLRNLNIKKKENYEFLKFEFDRRIFHFGNHFILHFENNNLSKHRKFLLFLRQLFLYVKVFLIGSDKILPNTIICNSYVSINNNIHSSYFNFTRPPWDISLKSKIAVNFALYHDIILLRKKLETNDFNQLTTDEFQTKIDEIKKLLTDYYSHPNILGAIFPNDVSFFEKISISILKKLNKKTILYLHGIPGIYSPNLYSQSDYLFVWGEKLKENYIRFGMNENKIRVVGHPQSIQINNQQSIRNDLSNILILTFSMIGGQFDDERLLGDRGDSILFLYQIENVLKKFGVREVTLRPHPSENKKWYMKYINNSFFKMDKSKSITSSLKNKSLVIGATSSVFTEALISGVNYIVFEPFNTKLNDALYKTYPPYDGSDVKLLVAKNESELTDIIKSKKQSDPSITLDYIGAEYCMEKTLNEILGK